MSTPCPACGAIRSRPAFRLGSPHFLRCTACDSLFEATPPSAEQIREIYEGKGYFVKDVADSENSCGYSDDYLADREFIEAKFDRVLGNLERYVKPGRLLDVGAGPGLLVAVAEARGWKAIGIDINEWAAEYGRHELGVDLRHAELNGEIFRGEQFDAVTMMDFIEHVRDPDDLLAQAARLVRPGGAMALLTPDSGSPVSRLLGARWPEVRKPGEHTVLFSRRGLTAALARNGFMASGWHWVGKEAPIATLLSDISSAAPGFLGKLRDVIVARPGGKRIVELDPHTKFCLYARRLSNGDTAPQHRPPRISKKPEGMALIEQAILDELESMAQARRLSAWTFDEFAKYVPDSKVLEVGAGIGTFTDMMLNTGAREVVALEPETPCAVVLERRFSANPRVTITTEALPDAPTLTLEASTFDLVVCHNVLEHIRDDRDALAVMAKALRPGGRLSLLVPAGPKLFGPLDDAYGHWRRYTADDLDSSLVEAGFEIESRHFHNVLGIAGWWTKNRRPGARIGPRSFRTYEILLAGWQPVERRMRPPFGLSLVYVARVPTTEHNGGEIPRITPVPVRCQVRSEVDS